MNTSNDGNNSNNNNSDDERRRKGKGRQKISIEKIENEASRQVTFSKRCAGVFKKASELSTLCGAESAVMVFSPGNKPFSFGHPNVEGVANQFLNANNNDGNPQDNAAAHMMMAHGEAAMHQRNHELISIEARLDFERQHKKELDENVKTKPSLDQLTYEQLQEMKRYVSSFRHEFEAKLKNNVGETSMWANPNPNHGTHQHGSPTPAGYGYGVGNIVPGGSSSTSFDNFGYTVQHPPTGPTSSGFNYGNNFTDPAAIFPHYGSVRASGSVSSGNRNVNEMGSMDEDPDTATQDTPDRGT